MAGVARGTFVRTSSRLESRFSSARGNFLAITSRIDPADSLRLLRNERESKRVTLEGGSVLPAGNSWNASMLIRGCPRVEIATGGPFGEASAIPFVSTRRLLLQ